MRSEHGLTAIGSEIRDEGDAPNDVPASDSDTASPFDISDSLDSLPDPATLTVEEVARYLRMSRSAAYEAIRRGELPYRKLGRRYVIPTPMLRRWLGMDAGNFPLYSGDSAEPEPKE